MNPYSESARIAAIARCVRPFRGRCLDQRRPVLVYRNLRASTWSIMQFGRVVGHADRVMLANVSFVVRARGAALAARGGARSVYAFACGTITPSGMGAGDTGPDLPVKIKLDSDRGLFVATHVTPNQPLRGASVVLFNERGASAAYTH